LEKRGRGQRGASRTFKTGKIFKQKFEEYCDMCVKDNKLPNIAGFCRYAGMSRQGYYQQKLCYPKEFEYTDVVLEDAAINARINDAFKIFYMTNKFKYKKNSELDINDTSKAVGYKELSTDELKKLIGKIKEETTEEE